jgi:hypothetical protein
MHYGYISVFNGLGCSFGQEESILGSEVSCSNSIGWGDAKLHWTFDPCVFLPTILPGSEWLFSGFQVSGGKGLLKCGESGRLTSKASLNVEGTALSPLELTSGVCKA